MAMLISKCKGIGFIGLYKVVVVQVYQVGLPYKIDMCQDIHNVINNARRVPLRASPPMDKAELQNIGTK